MTQQLSQQILCDYTYRFRQKLCKTFCNFDIAQWARHRAYIHNHTVSGIPHVPSHDRQSEKLKINENRIREHYDYENHRMRILTRYRNLSTNEIKISDWSIKRDLTCHNRSWLEKSARWICTYFRNVTSVVLPVMQWCHSYCLIFSAISLRSSKDSPVAIAFTSTAGIDSDGIPSHHRFWGQDLLWQNGDVSSSPEPREVFSFPHT